MMSKSNLNDALYSNEISFLSKKISNFIFFLKKRKFKNKKNFQVSISINIMENNY